jgi:predicted amidohydrolase YtcJ
MTAPKDIERLAKLSDVCMDFSPVLSFPHASMQSTFGAPIGEERYQSMFNVRSAVDTGIPVALASDWPSTLNPSPNGFHDIQAWVTRTDPYKPDSGTLNAGQAITLEEAIRGVTLGGAECLGFGWEDYKTDLIYPRYVKMFFDGSPDSYSSLMYEDYVERPGFKGSTHFPVDVFVQEFSEINALGLGLIVHVFGDASGGELVNAFTKVREVNGDNGIPLHYSHSVMTAPKDIERLAGTDVFRVQLFNSFFQAVRFNFHRRRILSRSIEQAQLR